MNSFDEDIPVEELKEIAESNTKLFKEDIRIFLPDDFNEDLYKDKPIFEEGVEKIAFGNNFNKPIGHYGYGSFLPMSLKSLELFGKFNQSIDLLPDNLVNLHFMKNCEFNMGITRFPEKLEILRFGDSFNNPLLTLPPNLKILEFGNNFNQPIHPLIYPKKLFTICFGDKFNQYVDDMPDSVENIKFGDNFNTEIINLPSNLKYIEFGQSFDKNIINILPSTIKKIRLCREYKYIDDIRKKYRDIYSIKN